MRPLIALVVVGCILGGLQAYMVFRPQPEGPVTIPGLQAPGEFALEVTMTFAAGADPFALEASDPTSLVVAFGGEKLLRVTDEIEAGQTIRIDNIQNISPGPNEFYVRASPRDQDEAARAIRVRVFRDDHPLAEESLWSEPGTLVEGTVIIDLKPSQTDLPEEDA